VALVALAMVLVHQAALIARGGALAHFIFDAPRTAGAASAAATSSSMAVGRALAAALRSAWHADREGLASVVPLTGVFLGAEALGRAVVWGPPSTKRMRLVHGDWLKRLVSLAGCSALLWLGWLVATAALPASLGGQPPSRRLANAGYCLLVGAVGTTLLSCCLGCFLGCASPPASAVLGALGANQLGAFLCANLLTGLVNTAGPSLPRLLPGGWLPALVPLESGPGTAAGVLACYAALVVAAALALERRRDRATGKHAEGAAAARRASSEARKER
jgi:hypothetical protein